MTCSIDECDERHYARGFCLVHYYRARRHGDPLTVKSGRGINHTPTPTYGAVHWRLAAERGRANDYACVDCSEPACEWSYNHADPDERLETKRSGSVVAYSLDLTNYKPRCRPCHRRFDATHATPTQKAGVS